MANTTMQQKETNYKNNINEGGEGYNPFSDAAKNEKIDNIIACKKSDELKFAEKWTTDITTSRRAEWKAKILAIGTANVKITDVRKLEIAQGWTMADLKKAIIIMEAK